MHLKDALAVDSDGEYQAPNAERALMLAGGQRAVPRWFGEIGTGRVDWTGLMTALRETGYAGWLVVESDKGPAPPAASLMQNAWTVRHVLQPLRHHHGWEYPFSWQDHLPSCWTAWRI